MLKKPSAGNKVPEKNRMATNGPFPKLERKNHKAKIKKRKAREGK